MPTKSLGYDAASGRVGWEGQRQRCPSLPKAKESQFPAVIPAVGIKKEKKMKKLLVVSIVAIAAFCGQAASVDWGVDWSYSKNADKGVDTFDDSGSYTYWVVALGTSSSTSGISVDADGNLVLGSGMTQFGSAGSGSQDMAGSIDGLSEANNGDFYTFVIYDAANGLYGIANAVAVSGIQDSPPQNGNLLTFQNDGGANGDSTPYMMANLAIPTSDIPEPTSGLLLLIGGSLLALRRKQK